MLKKGYSGSILEAGCDEAGRGCLAGPVFAAAVILPPGFNNEVLNDSKKLSRKNRDSLRKLIEESALAWSVAMVDNHTIDEINILNASFAAMHLAIKGLKKVPEFLIIDGNRFKPFRDIPYQCIVKGDAKYMSIAAASILAKTHRDEFMTRLHEKYPQYGWNRNMGYPTLFHRQAIGRMGITPYHRKSFRMAEQLNLFK